MRGYYELVLGIVSAHSGFITEEILKGRSELCTDARSLLVYFLSLRLTNVEIIRLTGLSKQAVSQLLNRYNDRKRHKFSLQSEERSIRSELDAIAE